MSTFSDLSASPAFRAASRIVCVCMLAGSVTLPAHAGLISAQAAAQEGSTITAVAPRAELVHLLNRDEVVRALQEQGVSMDMAQQRLAALSDDEALQLQADIASAPAGAGLIGAAVFVFLVLLATDVVGVTKVYPFTRPLR